MKSRIIFFTVCIFTLVSCEFKTKERYILPDNYVGFFGVLYESSSKEEMIKKSGYRTFPIPLSGVYKSGFGFAKGTIEQKFVYEKIGEIEDVDFLPLGRISMKLHFEELIKLRENPSKIFGIYIKSFNVNGGENGIAIYVVGSGADILNILNNIDNMYKIMNKHEVYENVRSMEGYINYLNQHFNELSSSK